MYISCIFPHGGNTICIFAVLNCESGVYFNKYDYYDSNMTLLCSYDTTIIVVEYQVLKLLYSVNYNTKTFVWLVKCLSSYIILHLYTSVYIYFIEYNFYNSDINNTILL